MLYYQEKIMRLKAILERQGYELKWYANQSENETELFKVIWRKGLFDGVNYEDIVMDIRMKRSDIVLLSTDCLIEELNRKINYLIESENYETIESRGGEH